MEPQFFNCGNVARVFGSKITVELQWSRSSSTAETAPSQLLDPTRNAGRLASGPCATGKSSAPAETRGRNCHAMSP